MTFVLVALGAALAVALELVEALAIVAAVGATRGWRDAGIGAAGGAGACAVLAAVAGPALAGVDADALRVVIGGLLLLFGLEWLRKATLRRAGRRSRSSSRGEYEETRAALVGDAGAGPDWVARAVAFKGVLLEGVEVVIIVSALAARPSGPAPAITGAALAVAGTAAAAPALRRRLDRVPETELKWVVGVLLCALGTFFAGEGLGVSWPGSEASILVLLVAFAGASELQVRELRG